MSRVFCRSKNPVVPPHGLKLLAFIGLAFGLVVGKPVMTLAQSTSGTVLGTLSDPSGNIVRDAIVELTNAGTNATTSTLSSETGSYQFLNVGVGTYTLSIKSPGFQKIQFSQFELQGRETKRLDAHLEVASQSAVVNVESSVAPAIQLDTSNIAETKTSRELIDLPVAISTRGSGSTSPISTLTAQPGVQTDASGYISVSGALPTQLSVTIDGISAMGPRTGTAGPINELFPSFNAIEEIRVAQTINPAEFSGVADITTISKAGTNALHGGVFENFQNSYLNARNTFSATKPALHMNDYGFYLSGPITIPKLYSGRDKTFIFTSFEGLQLPRQTVQVQSVPSMAMRGGDLSAFSGTLTGYPSKVIPASQISPLATNMLRYLFPTPNYGPAGAISNNYLAYFDTPIKSNQIDGRVDHNLTTKQQIYARMTYKNRRVQNVPSLGSALQGPYSQPEIDEALTGAYNYVITPAVINELRGGYSANHYATTYGIQASTIAAQLGLSSLSIPVGNAVPDVRITGYQQTGGTASSVGANKVWQLLDTLTWSKDKHTLKVGADYRYLTGLYTNVFASRRLGRYSFNGAVMNSLLGNGPATPFASFLLGQPDTTALASVVAPDTKGYSSHYGFFVQDDWKITSRFTLNVGVRYEYHPMFMDHLSNTANFIPDAKTIVNGTTVNGLVIIPNDYAKTIISPDFATSIAPTPIITAAAAGYPESLRHSQKTDFAPRIGFAWRPFQSDRTVIRGGYGRYIEALLGSALSSAWAVSASNVPTFTNTITDGKPALTFPYPFPSSLAVPGTQTFYQAFSTDYKDPYVQQWNLTLEQEFGSGIALRLSYDGNHGSNLGLLKGLNQVPVNTLGYAKAKALAPYPLWSYIAYQDSIGISNYQAATATLTKKFANALQFQGSYVFAKNLSNNAGYNPTGFAGEAGGTISDIFNPGYDYGNVSYTRRQRFLATFLYDLPFGKGKALLSGSNSIVNQLVAGWELAGVVVAQTGPFLTVLAGNDPSGTGFNQLVANGRADQISGVAVDTNQSISQWINPAAFATPANNIGRFANSAVGSVVGPGTTAVSLSLLKAFPITERIRFQLGASVANLFNHPNYDVPSQSNLTVGASGFGSITGLQSAEGSGPRAIQLTGRITF